MNVLTHPPRTVTVGAIIKFDPATYKCHCEQLRVPSFDHLWPFAPAVPPPSGTL